MSISKYYSNNKLTSAFNIYITLNVLLVLHHHCTYNSKQLSILSNFKQLRIPFLNKSTKWPVVDSGVRLLPSSGLHRKQSGASSECNKRWLLREIPEHIEKASISPRALQCTSKEFTQSHNTYMEFGICTNK